MIDKIMWCWKHDAYGLCKIRSLYDNSGERFWVHFISGVREGKTEAFHIDWLKEIPKELEDEPEEVIKLYMNL